MRTILLICIVFIGFHICYGNSTGVVKKTEAETLEVLKPENDIKSSTKEIQQLKIEISIANTKIVDLKERHNEQVEFYGTIQNTTIWIVSIVFLILSGIFTAFIWIFKKPDEIWKKLRERENEAKYLLQRLETQYQYQKSLFILGEKGLYSYNSNDWNMINKFASNANSLAKNKRNINDWLFIGLWNYKQKEFTEAIVAFKTATELDDKFEIAFKFLGNAYDENGDFDNAIKCFKKVIELNPQSDKAHNNLGIIYGDRGKAKKAQKYFRKALNFNPNDGYIYTNLFEHNLVNNLPFDDDLKQLFIEKFKKDKTIFSIYKMLSVYKKISEGREAAVLLEGWKKRYLTIGYGENYRAVKKWIDKNQNVNIKKELKKAMKFFKKFEQN